MFAMMNFIKIKVLSHGKKTLYSLFSNNSNNGIHVDTLEDGLQFTFH